MFRRTYRARFRTAAIDRRGEVISLLFATGDGDDVRIELATSAAAELRERLVALDRPAQRKPASRKEI